MWFVREIDNCHACPNDWMRHCAVSFAVSNGSRTGMEWPFVERRVVEALQIEGWALLLLNAFAQVDPLVKSDVVGDELAGG